MDDSCSEAVILALVVASRVYLRACVPAFRPARLRSRLRRKEGGRVAVLWLLWWRASGSLVLRLTCSGQYVAARLEGWRFGGSPAVGGWLAIILPWWPARRLALVQTCA